MPSAASVKKCGAGFIPPARTEVRATLEELLRCAQDDGGAAVPGAVPAGASVDAFSDTLNPRYVPELIPMRPSSVALNCGISRSLYTEAMKITPRISVQANIWKRWMLMPVGSLSTSRMKPSLFSVVGGVGLF